MRVGLLVLAGGGTDPRGARGMGQRRWPERRSSCLPWLESIVVREFYAAAHRHQQEQKRPGGDTAGLSSEANAVPTARSFKDIAEGEMLVRPSSSQPILRSPPPSPGGASPAAPSSYSRRRFLSNP